MKYQPHLLSLLALFSATLCAGAPEDRMPAVERVGVYDSRIVAFAHFWSEPVRQARDAEIATARAARDAGDKARVKVLSEQLAAGQKRSHLQVFSTAPATEAMAALQEKLPAIQQELGVSRLVSQWDLAALSNVPAANRVDVTDRLAGEFRPDEKRRKTIGEMKKVKPLPLEEATRLADAGKL